MDDCIHLVGLFERENKHEWKGENGPEETLSAIQNGEEELRVNDVVDDDNVKLCTEDLKQTNTNFMDIFSVRVFLVLIFLFVKHRDATEFDEGRALVKLFLLLCVICQERK